MDFAGAKIVINSDIPTMSIKIFGCCRQRLAHTYTKTPEIVYVSLRPLSVLWLQYAVGCQ